MSEAEAASKVHKRGSKNNGNKHDFKYTEVSLTDNVSQKDLNFTIKEEEMVDHKKLMNDSNIDNKIGQSMKKEGYIKVKIDTHKEKNTNENIDNTFELVTEAFETSSPKKEFFYEQDDVSSNVEKILCTPIKRSQNLLENEPNTTIEKLEVDQIEENFGKILRTPKIGKHGYSQKSTPEKLHASQKKRKVSMSTDSDSKSVKMTPEFSESVFINECESMQFLYDFDSLVEYEDCKMSDILLSSVLFDNVMQDTAEDNKSFDKEQPKDPLSIEEPEKPTSKCKSTKNNNKPKVDHPIKQTRIRTRMQERKKCASKISSKWNTDKSSVIENIKEKIDAIKKKEEFSLSVIKKLMRLEIELQHTVPPQHTVERNAGTHVPTQEETAEFQKYGPLRKEAFLPAEDKIIQNNWKMFCKIHDWDIENTKPFEYMRYGDKFYINNFQERQKFVQFLANGLPWRTLYSVYTRFKTLNKKYKIKRKYTPEEDQIILACVDDDSIKKNEKLKICELAKVLKRSTQSLTRHLRVLRRNQKLKKSKNPIALKVKWTLDLIKKFIKHLIDVTLSKNVDELKDAVIPRVVWVKMEQILCISANHLKSFWQRQLHMQLFCPHPIYINDIKIQLIEYLYGKGIGHQNEINWQGVAKYFDGVTSAFLCSTFHDVIRSADRQLKKENFLDVIEYLYNSGITQIRKKPTDKFLPRLKYTNNTLRLVDEIKDDDEIDV